MPVLEARGLSVQFGGVKALDDVDLVVDQDEIVGILGPNGAGKTTLLDCISGFTRPDRGQVLLHGHDVGGRGPQERVRLGLGRTFQHVGLIKSMPVLDNVITALHRTVRYGFFQGLLGLPTALREERDLRVRAMAALDFLGLADVALRPVGALPYGTQKICEVATALATDPEILVLDEPLAGTAPEEGNAFCDRLLTMRRELGLTIVMIEHHVPQVLRLADYVVVLNFGQVLAHGLPDDIRDNRQVAEAYMGKGAVSLA